MSTLTIEKNLDFKQKDLAKSLTKYRIKISMIKPLSFDDLWVKKPNLKNAFEVFIHELFTMNSREYFNIEISECKMYEDLVE